MENGCIRLKFLINRILIVHKQNSIHFNCLQANELKLVYKDTHQILRYKSNIYIYIYIYIYIILYIHPSWG